MLLYFKQYEERRGEHFLCILSPTRHWGGRVKRNVLKSRGLFCGFKNGKNLLKNTKLPKNEIQSCNSDERTFRDFSPCISRQQEANSKNQRLVQNVILKF